MLKTISSPFDSFLLQQDKSSLLDWSKSWNLCFNEQKYILVKFSASTPKVCEDYSLNVHILNTSSSHKDLGIIISSDLDWSDHFQYISSQAYKTFCLLRRTFCNCNSIHAKKLLYLSLVHPKLNYCFCVWRPHLIKDIVSLEKVQRRATKFILNDFSSDYKSRLLRLNLFPLMLLYEYYDIIFFFKCLKSPSSFNINNYVSFASSSTRSSANSKLLHTKSTTNSSHHFYFNRLPRLWNSLPVLSLEKSF